MTAQYALFRRTHSVPGWMKTLGVGGLTHTTDSDASMDNLVRLRLQNDSLRREVQDTRRLARDAVGRDRLPSPEMDPSVPPKVLEEVKALRAERDSLVWERRRLGAGRVLATLVTTIAFQRLTLLVKRYESTCEKTLKGKSELIGKSKTQIGVMEAVVYPHKGPFSPPRIDGDGSSPPQRRAKKLHNAL